MEKNNNSLLILEIALTVYFLIMLILVQSSTAQHNDDDEDSSWLNVRDYYNQFANFKESNNYNSIFPILYLLFVIIAGAIIWKLTHRTKERRYFSAEVKRQILKNQNYKCAICKRSNEVWDYDHKNEDRSNNKISNCQALCPNCHAKKTRGLLKNKAKSNLRLLKLFIISLIIIIIIYFLY
jgi:HNH endonuclease